ncbi:DUF4253 domain-containing protein [Crocosphaera chwakensis]|uniref:DUF4253 domain-containing protein n=1 Tax=Crocosphaera chwakensis CCY0110 TaxID=391612 RepID=A3IQE8_9CHRO|nr:DUF4253 domain-containing protein [Crocosphaera chwakensis]EAZ91223.1 hypothetical protein CY0110_11387 [Crocosphaera chwakensis CCY0110]
MINTVSELKVILADSELASFEMAELPILDTGEKALAIQVKSENALSSWQIMRDKLEETKRWPVLVWPLVFSAKIQNTWGKDTQLFDEILQEQDFFARRSFNNKSVQTIINYSKNVNIQQSLTQLYQNRQYDENLVDYLDYLEDDLWTREEKFGYYLDIETIENLVDSEDLQTVKDLEYCLFKWEIKEFPAEKALKNDYPVYSHWFDPSPDKIVLLLMPTINHWEILAYIHWYGSDDYSELVIALLKNWHEKYGSELICHYGTMLQLTTKTLPSSPDEAFQ